MTRQQAKRMATFAAINAAAAAASAASVLPPSANIPPPPSLTPPHIIAAPTLELMPDDEICIRDESYYRMQRAYCTYLKASFYFAVSAIKEIMLRREMEPNKTVIMDFDAVFASEDACTNYELFSCAVDFVKQMKAMFGTHLSIAIITARPEITDLIRDLWTVGLNFGGNTQRPNMPKSTEVVHIDAILYDSTGIGTAGSKLKNRNELRHKGATIIASIGDNVTDLVSDMETDMYAQTLNVLVPNVYRHSYPM